MPSLILDPSIRHAPPEVPAYGYTITSVGIVQIMDRLDMMARCHQEIFCILAGEPVPSSDAPKRVHRQWSYIRDMIIEIVKAASELEPVTAPMIYRALEARQVHTSKRNTRAHLTNLVRTGTLVQLPTGAYVASPN